MIATLLVAAQVAAAGCDVTRTESWAGDEYRLRIDGAVGLGPVPCRTVVLAQMNEIDVSSMKATIRHWDGARTVFREARLSRSAGEWVASLPELKADDRFSIRVRGKPGPGWRPEREPAQVIERTLRWEGPRKPTFGPGGTVLVIHKQVVRLIGPSAVAHVWFPEGSQEPHCDGSGTFRIHALGCELSGSEQGEEPLFTVGWVAHSPSSSFAFELADGEQLTLENVDVEAVGGSLESVEGKLRLTGPGSGSARITSVGGIAVPDNALEEVNRGSRVQSMPEPSIGLDFKGVEAEARDLGAVLDLVKSQVHRGRLPGSHPLKPRSLMKVRKSGWATPYESALLLTRYVEQLGFKAEAIPVRPSGAGAVVDGAPLGFTGAVVRVATENGFVWMDPSCAACAVGEIDPPLWSGMTFSDLLSQLPEPPESKVEQVLAGRRLEVRLVGPAATRLRQTIMSMPRDATRGRRIAELFGGLGAELDSMEGTSRLGEPIVIRVETQSRK